MKWGTCAIELFAIALVGCGVERVVTEPVRSVFGTPEPTPSNVSDVPNPGHPVAVPSPTPAARSASRRSNKASPTPKSAAAVQFPVAKPVPGKPGLVFSPFNAKGGYIDVSGYAPGSKVKDPDSGKIFVVP